MNLIKKDFKDWAAYCLCILFSILWGIWVLPNTVAIRHSAMVFGALIGLYVVVKNWRMLLNKMAIPILLILLLIIWVTLHLLFIGTDTSLQLAEYARVWKKIILIIPFSLGLGLALASITERPKLVHCWQIFYLGLTLPVIIFFIKYAITYNIFGWEVNNPYLLHDSYYQKNPYAISRALYSFFCIPSFATAVCITLSKRLKDITKFDTIYFLSILLTPILFYIEADRTGLLMVFLVLLISVLYMIKTTFNKFSLKKFLLLSLVFIFFLYSIAGLAEKYPNWAMTLENTKIGFMIDKQDSWKYAGTKPFPENKYGKTVDRSNYERISWAIAGSKLLIKYPNGYGLLSLSFDKISKKEWPGSILSMTHSGFLDFALGYGFIGIGLLLISFLISVVTGFNLPYFWSKFVVSGYFSLFLIMSIKELSYEITINALIFLILFISALSAGINYQKKESSLNS